MTESHLRGLVSRLSEHHSAIALDVWSTIGYEQDVDLDVLCAVAHWGKIEGIDLRCSEPDMTIRLRDEPLNQVSVTTSTASPASESVRIVRVLAREWRSYLQIPCTPVPVIAALLLPGWVQSWYASNQLRAQRLAAFEAWKIRSIEAHGEVATNAAIDAALASIATDRTGSVYDFMQEALSYWPAALFLATVGAVAWIFRLHEHAGAVLAWIRDEYRRAFPAFKFDLPSSRDAYSPAGRRLMATVSLLVFPSIQWAL
jgi:hypothetical protein